MSIKAASCFLKNSAHLIISNEEIKPQQSRAPQTCTTMLRKKLSTYFVQRTTEEQLAWFK